MPIDLSTTYLGFHLRSPLVPSSSPLSLRIDHIKRMEDAGASAVVLYSVFEEQLTLAPDAFHRYFAYGLPPAEGAAFFPEHGRLQKRPEDYLEHIRRAKQAVDIPIIASLNVTSNSG